MRTEAEIRARLAWEMALAGHEPQPLQAFRVVDGTHESLVASIGSVVYMAADTGEHHNALLASILQANLKAALT